MSEALKESGTDLDDVSPSAQRGVQPGTNPELAGGPADPPGVSKLGVFLLIAGTLGTAIAYLVPMVFTLPLKLDQLYPGQDALLGYIIGIGSVVAFVTAPLSGILSDRTRSRWGRRRPFTAGGLVIGIIAIAMMAYAPNFGWLTAGWVLANLGWGTAMGSIGNVQADRLLPSQRGKVGAFIGVATQVAPVAGILMVSPIADRVELSMWVPALVGLPFAIFFLILVPDADSRAMVFDEPVTVKMLIRSYGFRPRDFPDFAWNWLGRAFFFFGMTFTSTYSTFFYAARMDIHVSEVAPIAAVIAGFTTVFSALGAIGSGWFSDKLGKRRIFVVVSVLSYAVGTATSAFAHGLPQLIVGGVFTSTGLAVFLAINQAMLLDILPMRETQAGRFLGIASFSQKIPNAIAPLIAPILLGLGASGSSNFTVLYLSAGVLGLIGGLIIVTRVKGVS